MIKSPRIPKHGTFFKLHSFDKCLANLLSTIVYNTITLLRERAREQYSKVKLERHNFYTGKADPAVYEEEPFPYKVREKDAIQRYLDADDRLNKVDMKIRYYDATLKFLEEIIKTVANRTFQIKNAIEWQKFQAGF